MSLTDANWHTRHLQAELGPGIDLELPQFGGFARSSRGASETWTCWNISGCNNINLILMLCAVDGSVSSAEKLDLKLSCYSVTWTDCCTLSPGAERYMGRFMMSGEWNEKTCLLVTKCCCWRPPELAEIHMYRFRWIQLWPPLPLTWIISTRISSPTRALWPSSTWRNLHGSDFKAVLCCRSCETNPVLGDTWSHGSTFIVAEEIDDTQSYASDKKMCTCRAVVLTVKLFCWLTGCLGWAEELRMRRTHTFKPRLAH